MPAPDEQSVQDAVARFAVHGRVICVIVDDDQNLVELFHTQLFRLLRYLLLLRQDVPQRGLVPVFPPALLPVRIDPQVLPDVLFDGLPLGVHVNARTQDVHALEAAPVLLEDH